MPHRPDVPCARCGKLLWSGSTGGLPAGQRTCRGCRRIEPRPYGPRSTPTKSGVARTRPKPYAKRHEIQCVTCGVLFMAGQPSAKYCGDECRPYVYRHPTDADRRRWRQRPSSASRGYGAGWLRLRAQVLAEEADCGFCGEPVDKDLRHPDPFSPSVDHIVRKENGGTDDRSNLRLAHFGCNAAGRPRLESRRAGTVSCFVCGRSFKRQHDRQRACSRPCGVAMRALNSG